MNNVGDIFSNPDIISNIIVALMAIGAFVFSILSWIKSTKINNGQVEMEINRLISERKNAFLEIDNKANNKQQVVNFLIEQEINVYEIICSMYIDKKVDKKRFKKNYFHEIKNLVENGNFSRIGKFDKRNCHYESILKVYDEWYS